MNSFATRWTNLQSRLNELTDDSTALDLIRVLVSWFRANPSLFEEKAFTAYCFESYLGLREADYPVDAHALTSYELRKIKSNIAGYGVEDINVIPQYLRDVLASLLILEVDEDCPVCSNSGLGVYVSNPDRQIAYECKQCGYAKYQDGSRVESRLTLATREELHSANLI